MTAPDTAPRVHKRGLFEALGYEPHAGQLLVHRSIASRRVLACGVRWGKTTACSMEAAAELLVPREEALGWIVGPTYGHSGRIFEMVAAAFEAQMPHRIRELNRRQQVLVIQNLSGGLSKLVGKSADNPASLLGDGLDFLVVDEAAQMEREVWEEALSQRLLDRRGWALVASTPRGKGWFYRQWRRGQKGRDKEYESWQSPSAENPHLDHALIEAERARLAPEAFAEQYGAEFLGEDLEPCDLCRGPDARLPRAIFVPDIEQLARCPECGGVVAGDGQTRAGAKRMIILHGGRVVPLALPPAQEQGPIPVSNGTAADARG